MFIDLFTRSGRLFKHKQLSFCLLHSYSVALNYRVRECVEAAGFGHIVRFPQANPRHKPSSISPSLTACNSIRLHVPHAVVVVRGLALCAVNSCWCVL